MACAKKIIKYVAYTLIIIVCSLWLMSVSCVAGIGVKGFNNLKPKENFTGPPVYTKSLGGFNNLCKVGKGGVWYDCSRGAGTYLSTPESKGEVGGFYQGTESNNIPKCMNKNCGRFNTPQCAMCKINK